MARLSTINGYCKSAVTTAINYRAWPAVEKIIAEHIGVPADQIWPERYQDGLPRMLTGRYKTIRYSKRRKDVVCA